MCRRLAGPKRPRISRTTFSEPPGDRQPVVHERGAREVVEEHGGSAGHRVTLDDIDDRTEAILNDVIHGVRGVVEADREVPEDGPCGLAGLRRRAAGRSSRRSAVGLTAPASCAGGRRRSPQRGCPGARLQERPEVVGLAVLGDALRRARAGRPADLGHPDGQPYERGPRARHSSGPATAATRRRRPHRDGPRRRWRRPAGRAARSASQSSQRAVESQAHPQSRGRRRPGSARRGWRRAQRIAAAASAA